MLRDYVEKYALRGACTCGRCCDAVENPEKHQPTGETIDLTFFKVGKHCDANKEEFQRIAKKEFPHWFDGKEHSYLQAGADIGDQGKCLMAFGLGHLLGAWKCYCPETMMPFMDDDSKKLMAGNGMISIKTITEEK